MDKTGVMYDVIITYDIEIINQRLIIVMFNDVSQ